MTTVQNRGTARWKNTLAAETTKALTLRSIRVVIAAALIAPPALALISGLVFDPGSPAARTFPVASHGFEVAGFGQPLIILLAALIAGSEYTDGQLQTTLSATPQRGRVLAAKAIVTAGSSALIALVMTCSAVLVKRAVLDAHGAPIGELTTGMAWNVVGVVVNYALIGLISLALTVLARSIILPLATLVPLVLGLTVWLATLIPPLRYLPDVAGIQLLLKYPGGLGFLEPIPGGLVMFAWTIGFLAAAAWSLRTRDVGA